MRKEEHLSSNLILSYSAGTFHRAKTTPLLQDGVQPATSTEIGGRNPPKGG